MLYKKCKCNILFVSLPIYDYSKPNYPIAFFQNHLGQFLTHLVLYKHIFIYLKVKVFFIFIPFVFLTASLEQAGNPAFEKMHINQLSFHGLAPGGNMEGKELRFGQALTALYVVATTGLSCGAVNAMHNSLMPLGGMVPLLTTFTATLP